MENQDEKGRERLERLLLEEPEPVTPAPSEGIARALKLMQMGGQVGVSGITRNA